MGSPLAASLGSFGCAWLASASFDCGWTVAGVSAAVLEFMMFMSCDNEGNGCIGTALGRTRMPLAAALLRASATARAALSSTPLPRGSASPITAAFRDLFTKLLEFPDLAAAWNACTSSGFA